MHGRGIEMQHIHAAGFLLYLTNEFRDTDDIAGVRHAAFRGKSSRSQLVGLRRHIAFIARRQYYPESLTGKS
ncbi:hypothetical protein NUKP38_28970 [Klebsiella variicola]|nr:hypothetical protein NUKP38_28970 [Klebsiella variicola]